MFAALSILRIISLCAVLLISTCLTQKLESDVSPIEVYQIPQNCSQRERMQTQPHKTDKSRVKKCCPFGEALSLDNNLEDQELCSASGQEFHPSIISATFYDNCIEDAENETTLPFEVTSPCNISMLFKSDEDSFYVMQDGSLLILDNASKEPSYKIEKNYCLDTDSDGNFLAFVCLSPETEKLSKGEIVFTASIMLCCTPLLALSAYIHIAIRELRNLHGYIICSMATCLAIGQALLSIMLIFDIQSAKLGYIIQFFMLSHFFLYFCLSFNLAFFIWIRLPRKSKESRHMNFTLFMLYMIASTMGAIAFVILAARKGYSGVPSYFLHAFTLSIRNSQQFFIPPVSILICGSFFLQLLVFFGLKQMNSKEEFLESTDTCSYDELKSRTTSIYLIGILNIVLWLMELVTFYSHDRTFFLMILDFINSLHGLLFFGIFLLIPYTRKIISSWWYNKGTHHIEKIELALMRDNETPASQT